jgi:hypothetical protein
MIVRTNNLAYFTAAFVTNKIVEFIMIIEVYLLKSSLVFLINKLECFSLAFVFSLV